MLKRLADAERDGDRIYAVIEGVGGSSDGRHLGLTAPRKEGQQRALERAYAPGGRARRPTLGLVEAHGTGTVVGDRTELATLTEVFARARRRRRRRACSARSSRRSATPSAPPAWPGSSRPPAPIHHGVLPPTGQPDLARTRPTTPQTSPFRFLDQARPWADDRAPGRRQRLRLRRHQLPRRALGLHRRRRAAATASTSWPAELFLFRAEQAADGETASRELSTLVDAILARRPAGPATPAARPRRHRVRGRPRAGPGRGRRRRPRRPAPPSSRRCAAGDTLAATGCSCADAASAPRPAPTVGASSTPGQGSQRTGMLADLFVAFPRLATLLRIGRRAGPTPCSRRPPSPPTGARPPDRGAHRHPGRPARPRHRRSGA